MPTPENAPIENQASLMQTYSAMVERGDIQLDPDQQSVMHVLQDIYAAILEQPSLEAEEEKGFFSFFSRKKNQSTPPPITGLYLYGGVGRGKTFLVDLFYEHLPIKKKLRLHFHRFMQIVHEELAKLDGVEDPLAIVAKSFSDKAHVLCFDEFHVIDITDAMLLGRLLEHLFANGMVLVTTSNFHPDDLYKNGLQRERFVPAIQLLKKHTQLVAMGGEYDYRSEAFKELGIYYFINDADAEERLNTHFTQLSGVQLYSDKKEIIINQRTIPVTKVSPDIVWFQFDDLCNTPRSTEDFTQIAAYFKTVLISDIPAMDANMDDAARRFINLIDTFYDMQVNIVVSAAVPPEELYSGQKLAFEFDRAVSRINEMQTEKYIETTQIQT